MSPTLSLGVYPILEIKPRVLARTALPIRAKTLSPVPRIQNKGRDSPRKGTQMATEDKDKSVLNHIDRLVKEEEGLYGRSELTNDDRERLGQLKVELDQCWDLLRQRRALREFGDDPDKAKVRPARIVENYEQ